MDQKHILTKRIYNNVFCKTNSIVIKISKPIHKMNATERSETMQIKWQQNNTGDTILQDRKIYEYCRKNKLMNNKLTNNTDKFQNMTEKCKCSYQFINASKTNEKESEFLGIVIKL